MKLGLQIVLGVLSLIPLVLAIQNVGGGAEALQGGPVSAALDSQFRYLSTFYLALTALIWWIIPNIEKHAVPVRILIGAVFLGCIARAYSLMQVGHPGEQLYAGMIIEFFLILVIPWQAIVAKRASAS
ncbi:MAG: DUF4345 domain-containing protein [Hyphomonadaceae bacterium]